VQPLEYVELQLESELELERPFSTEQFIDEAKDASGFSGAKLALLDDYFQQRRYGETRPTILPEDFA
jgi:hypothetical protein